MKDSLCHQVEEAPTWSLTRISQLLTCSFTQLYPIPLWYLSLPNRVWETSASSCRRLMSRETLSWSIFSLKVKKKLGFVLCVAPGNTTDCFAPWSPVLHPLEAPLTSSCAASPGMEEDGSVSTRGLCPYETKPSTLNLKPKPFSSWQVTISEPFPPLHYCYSLHYSSSPRGYSWARSAQESKEQSSWGCAKGVNVGIFPVFCSTAWCHSASLQVLSDACGSMELPHQAVTLRVSRMGIPHCTSPPLGRAAFSQELQASRVHPASPHWRNETTCSEVKIIADTKPQVGDSLLSWHYNLPWQMLISF